MDGSISHKVVRLHNELRFWWRDLCRIGVALYDPHNDQLSTFVSSDKQDGENPLEHYQVTLSQVPSLKELADLRRTRVVSDLGGYGDPANEHTRRLLKAGFRSSYTVPMYCSNGHFSGFLFFDAEQADYFTPELTHHLDVYAELLSALIQAEIAPTQVLSAAVYTAKRFTDWRDEETGAHLARVSHYSRLMGYALADSQQLEDEYIQFLFQFAPLHDIGKVAIPDSILLAPRKLSEEEFQIMQTHVGKGLNIVNELIDNFGLGQVYHLQLLRDIVLHHHERWDGKGYPNGLAGTDIPLAARIVAVADCFDALLTERPYKPAWGYQETCDYMREHAGSHFDPACVEALLARPADIDDVRQRFRDE